MEYITHSDAETRELGKKLAADVKGGDIVLLSGELGAGKTTLVKGLAGGLGIKEEITSPTFTLMNIYHRKHEKTENMKTLVHIDTYRLRNEQELIDIGVEDYLGNSETVCVIEWPEKLQTLLKNKKVIHMSLQHLESGGRKIVVF